MSVETETKPLNKGAPARRLSPEGYKAVVDLRSKKKTLYLKAVETAQDPNYGTDAILQERFKKIEGEMIVIDDNIVKLEKLDPGEEDPYEEYEPRTAGGKAKTTTPPPSPSRTDGSGEFRVYQRSGETDYDFQQRQRRSSEAYAKAVSKHLVTQGKYHDETRAIQSDVDYMGGALVMPEQLYRATIKAVDNMLWVRRYATVEFAPNAASLGVPTLDSNVDSGDWTSEVQSIQQDTGMKYGKRALTPTPIRKRILASNMFLRRAFEAPFMSNDDSSGQGRNGRDQIMNRLAYAVSNTADIAFWTGNGIGQPLGMFTASNRGIPVSRDIVCGTTTAFTYTGLINAKYNQKVQYYPTSMWCFNKSGMSQLMKLVDSNNRPLLNFSTIPNQPDTLLGNTIMLSENIPGVFTTGQYVGIYGDLSYYIIADSLRMTMAVADQLYLEKDQTGFFIGAEIDAMPALAEAFTRLKLA